jgi:hypothetical protein
MKWLRQWFPETKTVYVLEHSGDWLYRKAYLTAQGWTVTLWPSIGEGVHFLKDDGSVEGRFLTAWRAQ